jgi:hypothetical protein
LKSVVKKNMRPRRMQKANKRVLIGETREEEAARLEKEIAAHPVTRCEPGERKPLSRPGWSSKPFIPLSERIVAEGIAKKIMRKAKPES